MHYFFYLYYLFSYYLLLYHFLHYLRHLNHLLNNTRHNHYLLNYLLHLHNFWYLHHLLNDLFNYNWHFFDSVDDSWHFHYLLLSVLHHFRYLDVNIHVLLHFYDSWFFHNKGLLQQHLLYMHRFYPLYNWFLNDQLFDNRNLFDDRHFNIFFNFNRNLFDNLNKSGLYRIDFLYLLLNYQFLPDNFNLFDLSDYVVHLLYYLYYLRHLLDSLLYLNYGHDLLDYTINDLVFHFNMVLHLTSCTILDHLYYFLDYSLYFYYLWHLDYSLYDFLDNYWNLHYLFNDLFNSDYLLSGNLHLLEFRLDMVHNSLNLHWYFNFHNLLLYNLHLHHLRNNLLHLDQLLNDSWHLNNCLYFLLIRYQLLSFCLDYHWLINWNVNYFLNLFYLLNLNYLLNYLVNGYYFRHFNYPLNNLFNNFLYLNDLRSDSKHLKDIINIDHIHNLSLYHANHSFINFKHHPRLDFNFLKLLQNSLQQNSEVELNLPFLFSVVSIHIIYLHDMRHKFNYLDESFDFISLNYINDLLLQKLGQFGIDFSLDSWVFQEQSS